MQLRRTIVILATLFIPTSSDAQTNLHYITKTQEQGLKSSIFLTRDYIGTSKRYRPYIDFAIDCGVSISVDPTNIEGLKSGERSYMIDDISNLKVRLNEYPVVLKVLGKWDAQAQKNLSSLERIYGSAVGIANKSAPSLKKLEELAPLLNEAEKISKEMASAAGVDYAGGCGAGPEDSQKIDFVIAPKPKSAFYILDIDFDACKRVLTDPYDTTRCEAWTRIQPKDNELSGTYKYRITWDDGTTRDDKLSALAKGRKIIKIEK
jgi:hypothetical protein